LLYCAMSCVVLYDSELSLQGFSVQQTYVCLQQLGALGLCIGSVQHST
jgi:hypothetical protein